MHQWWTGPSGDSSLVLPSECHSLLWDWAQTPLPTLSVCCLAVAAPRGAGSPALPRPRCLKPLLRPPVCPAPHVAVGTGTGQSCPVPQARPRPCWLLGLPLLPNAPPKSFRVGGDFCVLMGAPGRGPWTELAGGGGPAGRLASRSPPSPFLEAAVFPSAILSGPEFPPHRLLVPVGSCSRCWRGNAVTFQAGAGPKGQCGGGNCLSLDR